MRRSRLQPIALIVSGSALLLGAHWINQKPMMPFVPVRSAHPEIRASSTPDSLPEAVKGNPEVKRLLADSVNQSLRPIQVVESMGVHTEKFQHYYKGLEVIGSVVLDHRGRAGEQVQAMIAHVDLNTQPDLTPQDVVDSLSTLVPGARPRGEPLLKILPSKDRATARLIYTIPVQARGFAQGEVWVDANSGALVADLQKRESP